MVSGGSLGQLTPRASGWKQGTGAGHSAGSNRAPYQVSRTFRARCVAPTGLPGRAEEGRKVVELAACRHVPRMRQTSTCRPVLAAASPWLPGTKKTWPKAATQSSRVVCKVSGESLTSPATSSTSSLNGPLALLPLLLLPRIEPPALPCCVSRRSHSRLSAGSDRRKAMPKGSFLIQCGTQQTGDEHPSRGASLKPAAKRSPSPPLIQGPVLSAPHLHSRCGCQTRPKPAWWVQLGVRFWDH